MKTPTQHLTLLLENYSPHRACAQQRMIWWLTVSCWLWCTLLVGQTTTTQVLQRVMQDELYQRMEAQQAFFTDNNLSLPWMEEVELRTETHEFNSRLQEYAMRVQWNTPRQRRAQDQLNTTEAGLRQAEQRVYLEDQLYQQYALLLRAWYYEQRRILWAEEEAWYPDRERVLQQRLREAGARAYDDWLDFEADYLAYQQRGQRLASEANALRALLPLDSLSWTDWPSPAALSMLLNGSAAGPLRPDLLRRQLEVELVNKERAVEVAENRNLINFLQVRYRGEDENPALTRQVTLGVGVTLPFRNADDVKIQYLALEAEDEQLAAAHRQRDYQQALQAARQQWQFSTENYRLTDSLQQSYAVRYSATALRAQGLTDPELLLKAKGTEYRQRRELLEQAHRMYQAYLGVVYHSGRMVELPLKNWWSVTGATL